MAIEEATVQMEAARVWALSRWRQEKLDDHVNIAEAIRAGAPTCDANTHLNNMTVTGIDVWNSDH